MEGIISPEYVELYYFLYTSMEFEIIHSRVNNV